MKLIIAGSRSITDLEVVFTALALSNFSPILIVSGAARGVDTLGEEYAKLVNLPVIRFPAKWEQYGRSAGHIRNEEMGDFADALLAIWDGKSPGTRGMIMYMKSLHKPVFTYMVQD